MKKGFTLAEVLMPKQNDRFPIIITPLRALPAGAHAQAIMAK